MTDELLDEHDERSVFFDENHSNRPIFWIIGAKFLPSEQK